jgi:hypothetical protein
MRQALSFLVLWLGLPLGAQADLLPIYSLRELTIQAPTVVLATPVAPKMPGQYVVVESLRGELEQGDTLTLVNTGPHDLQVIKEGPPPLKKPRPQAVAQVLLFLAEANREDSEWKGQLYPSGIRVWTVDREVYLPHQPMNPGGYVLERQPDLNWGVLVNQVRREVEAVDRLRSLKQLVPVWRRNRALLRWIERHRHEMGSTITRVPGGEPSQGWGELEPAVFQWVLASGVVADCWRAICLHASLYGGVLPPLEPFCFANPRGRAFLLSVASSHDALAGDRLRALELLQRPGILWPAPSAEHPAAQPLTRKEFQNQIEQLLPLIEPKGRDEELPIHAVRVLAELSRHGGPGYQQVFHDLALPSLMKAYRGSGYRALRAELAETIYQVEGPRGWEKVARTPQGILVRLHDLDIQKGKLFFWASMRGPSGVSIQEKPTLMLKRTRFGLVVERKLIPLPAVNPPASWDKGWSGTPYLLVEWPIKDLTEGTWRVSLEGTVGKDKAKWKSEPWQIQIHKPTKKSRRNGPSPFQQSALPAMFDR